MDRQSETPQAQPTEQTQEVRMYLSNLKIAIEQPSGNPSERLATLKERMSSSTDAITELPSIDALTKAIEGETALEQEAREALKKMLSERRRAIEQTQRQIRELRKANERSASTSVASPRPEFHDEKFWQPQTWSKETMEKRKQMAKNLGIFAGAATVIVGGSILLKKIANWFKGATQKTGEKAHEAWGYLKTTAVVTALTGGVLAILKGPEFIRAWIQGQSAEELARAQEALVKQQKELSAMIEEKKKQLNGLTGDALDRAKNEIKELKEKRNALGGTSAESSDFSDKDETEAPHEGNAHNENLQEIERVASDELIAKSLIAFHDNPEWTASNKTKVTQVNDAIEANRTRPMSDIFACVENGKASEQIDQARFTIGSDDVVNRTAAARVVIQACADVKKYALESGVTEEELQAMSLEEYIKFVALNNPVPISILSALHESQGDWRKIAGIFDGGTFTGSKALEEELMRFAKEKTQALHLEREFTLQDVLQTMGMLMSLTTGSIGSVNIPSVTPEQKIAQSIVETIKRDDTYKYLIPFFHELFPNDSWSSDMAKNEEVAKNILRSRMSPAQAIRCYFYRKMMDNGNPAGIVMMQGEILNYFTKNDESWFDFDTFRYLHRLANAFVSGSWKESKKLYEQLGINVSDDVLEKAEVAIGQVTTKGALHTVGAVAAGTVSTIGHGLSFVGATAHEHPWLVGSALGTASFGGDALRYVNATPLSTAEALKEIASKQGAGRTLARAMTSRFGVATELSIATAHEQFQIIQTTIEGLRTSQAHTGAHIIGEAFFKELNTCMRKGSEARWLQFEANLQKVIRALGAGSKTGEELEKVATAIKSLLADKKTLNVIEFASYINVRIPFVGGQKTLAYLSRARRATLRGVRGAGRLAARTIPGAARAMRAIPGKGALRKAGRVLGPAAIIGLSAMEIVDYYASLKPELQEKLAAETDPLKRQILAKELFDAQWKTGGDALATGMILSGIGAPIGATFFVAGEVYDITRESIDEGARYMLLDEGDFAGMSPGEILAKIKESSDGYATFGQRFAVGADVESANIAPRFDAYRAYFMLKSQDLASVDAIALTQEEMRLSTEERDARLATLTEDQARRFSVAACEYIQHKTEGRCTIVNATTLKDAEYYAQMVVAEWRRNLATNAPMQFASLSWDQREAKVQEMRTAAADTVVQAIDDTRVRSPDFVEAHLLLSLLDAVDDDLSTLEERILEADVKGFEWTGKADESREYARSAAAAFVSETLKSQAAQLLSKESITREDFIAAQTAISTMLSSLDINRLAEDGETIGKAHDTSSMLLTVDGIAAYIDSAEQPVT